MRSGSWERPNADGVEIGDAVGIGPQRHFPGLRDGPISRGEQLLAIKCDGEAVALGLQRERVPFIGRDLGIGARKLLALALYHPVKAHIILERIGARDVIVIRGL